MPQNCERHRRDEDVEQLDAHRSHARRGAGFGGTRSARTAEAQAQRALTVGTVNSVNSFRLVKICLAVPLGSNPAYTVAGVMNLDASRPSESNRPLIGHLLVRVAVDRSLPPLFLALARGDTIGEAELEVVRADSSALDLRLGGVRVWSVSASLTAAGFVADLELSFETIFVSYAAASGGAPSVVGWDVGRNAAIPTASPTPTVTATLAPPTRPPPPTGTPTTTPAGNPVFSPTRTDTAGSTTPTPTATPLPPGPCVGDCNGDESVAINELVLGVNIALEIVDLDTCVAFDTDADLRVAINEVVAGVSSALRDSCTAAAHLP